MTPERPTSAHSDSPSNPDDHESNPTTARDSSDEQHGTHRDDENDHDPDAPLDEKLSYNDR
jgi:hypothetical protein